MDKKLIRMCDCEEVRSKWNAYIGQQFIVGDWDIFFYSVEVDRECEDTLIITGEGKSKRIYEPRDGVVWIPRIEDVLSWLGNKVIQVHQMDSTQTWTAYCSPTGFAQDIVRGGYGADTPLKALLKAFMHLEHSVEWDGKVWK